MKINSKIRSFILFSIALIGIIQFAGCVKKTDMQSIIAADESITRSSLLFTENSRSHYNALRTDYAINPLRAKAEFDKATELVTATNEVIDLICYIKHVIISEADGRSIEKISEMDIDARNKGESVLQIINGLDDKQIPEKVLFEGNISNFDKLEDKLELYKNHINEIWGPKYKDRLHFGLEIKKADCKNQAVASIVLMLNTILMEVLNAESETMAFLYEMIDEERYNFSNVKAVVVPKKDHVKEGEKFEADIFIAAYDTAFQHRVKVGSDIDSMTLEIVGPVQNLIMENGVCKYSIVASGKGEKTIGGSFEVQSKNGCKTRYPFIYSYFVE